MDSDYKALLREKPEATPEDIERLSQGEPLAYILGHIPFLGVSVDLTSRPLIPRPETEWWTEELIQHIGDRPLRVLDLCAGSGAIGLAILKHCKNARVSFGELTPSHTEDIERTLRINGLDASRATIRTGDLFEPFDSEQFDLIATNPPYIPSDRVLPESVSTYEPSLGLFSGKDGLDLIRRIAREAPLHLSPGGELWLECDIANIEAAKGLFEKATIRSDQYGRPRLLVAYY